MHGVPCLNTIIFYVGNIIGVGTGGGRGAMAPTDFVKCILAPPLFTSLT